jgi:hypothetical protein
MDNTFNFSIRQALCEAWVTFKTHYKFFLGVAAITVLLNIAGGRHTPWIVELILGVASFFWSIIWLKLSLAAAKNEEGKLTAASLWENLPSWKDALYLIGIGIVGGILFLCGLILLVIPGIYIGVRLSLSNLAYLDRKEGVKASLRYSWNITKGKGWTVLLTGLVVIALYILGVFALGVGLLVAYPIASILMARLYYALSDDYTKDEAVVVQPAEIPADLPEVHTETESEKPQ